MLKLAFICVIGGVLMLLGFLFDKKPFKPCLYVAAQTLNIRESPNMQADIYGKFYRNDIICEYFSVENDFLETKLGWVSLKYLRLNPLAEDSGYEETKMVFDKNTKKFSFTSIQKHIPESKDSWLYEAKKSLANANYKKAKDLALQINQIDPKNIKSWEIFIKSLYLEGNRQEAIATLEQFLVHYYDEGLMRLLGEMQKGNKI